MYQKCATKYLFMQKKKFIVLLVSYVYIYIP